MARFTADEQHVLAVGTGGLTLLGLPDGNILDTFSSKGSSGMVTMLLNPRSDQLAVVTGRSVHGLRSAVRPCSIVYWPSTSSAPKPSC